MAGSLSEELRALELQLLQPDFRRNRAAVAALLADDFIEYGSSGRIFTKPQILDLLAAETQQSLTLSDFAARLVAPSVALVTFRAVRDGDPPVISLRSSLWTRNGSRWQLMFHQGTRLT